MNPLRRVTPQAAPLLLAAAAALAVAAALSWAPTAGHGRLGPLPVWAALVLLGAVAGFHRPFGRRAAAAGVLVVPVLLATAGPGGAALGIAAAVLLAEAARTAVGTRVPLTPPNRWRPLASLGAAARSAVAAVAGGFAAWGAAGDGPVAAALAGAAAWAGVSLVLTAVERDWRLRAAADRDLRRRLPSGDELLGLGLEVLAWGAGAAVAVTVPAAEAVAGAGAGAGAGAADGPGAWLLPLALVAALAAASAEAARQAALHAGAEERLGDMDRVRGAGERMVGGLPEIGAVAERIREECENVVPFHYFQLELLSPGGGEIRSWWAPAAGHLVEGTPEIETHPPPLPGIHRRGAWRTLERNLAWGERSVARLTLWCDPRRLEPEDVELLDALLPQMATSIHQALLDRQAREDRLTGAAVRHVFDDRLLAAFRVAVEEGRPVAVILCDLDRFKSINDTHGHIAGDRALAAAAGALMDHKRTGDLLARYGGEEFALLLEATDGPTALAVAERLRLAVDELPVEVDGTELPLTVSCGVAAFPELHVKTPAELVMLADGALYEAKRRGRNRCLHDLGGGRYRTPRGDLLESETRRPETAPPRIFA